ncbi:MAG: C-GCAxxG-C-C family protein [Candidatus Borkfalkiaceae bacterium]|nr:C-GCAxxG-C-C family protein [Christensenellaceae bacterium]MDY3723785.1 C-GCAxxG-C-C family protein [Christensenellaceae bacterium]
MSRGQKAEEYFKSGYNCAQAVVMAFADVIGGDTQAYLRLSSSFGGGIGRLREVCGAFSGSCMVAGLLRGYDNENGVDKGSHYALIQRLALKNKLQNGSIICKELLGATVNLSSADPSVRTAEYVKKRPCAELCRIAADILAEELGID